ncbi:PLP-dependent transferase [Schlesneria paludicola]|uniref:PLP-dependent transferase n=1 Tax=Schlesneria paludicola TaxID=360056 RepID=UPI00029A4770|nr:PLP-dependent transferase [Schlesneria paludicola]
MTTDIYAQFGIPPIVNAVGYASRVSGSCPHPDVIAAMAAASTQYVEIDDVLRAASQLIQRSTGAEAGIITCGAAAALTLAAAACLAGNRPELMDALPDASQCPRDEIIYPLAGPFDYDHPIRLSGAKLVSLDYKAPDALAQIERQIHARTAAIGWVWLSMTEIPDLTALIELAHRHGLPVIIDAAFSMLPVENLTSFIHRGADLVAYSGGKHLGGPQASGILCGRTGLIRSAWVQMVDMDVRAGTWSLQAWIDEGWISRPPRHGIGRSMKVSKESMIGLMAALERYAKRDHQAEIVQWHAAIDEIQQGLSGITELRITKRSQAANGQPYPNLLIESGTPPTGMTVRRLILKLRSRPKKIILAEDETNPDQAVLNPNCLLPGDAGEIVTSIRNVIAEHRR